MWRYRLAAHNTPRQDSRAMLAPGGYQDPGFRQELRLSPLFYQDGQILIFPVLLPKATD
jgi:hypothetical protein